MSQISNLAIPITVYTAEVPPALRKVEKAVEASAKKISATQATVKAGVSAFGGERAVGFASKFGGTALGGAAMNAAFVAGPMIAATSLFDSMMSSVQGSTEALKKFQQTGELATGMNSAMLQMMADAEQSMKQRKTAGFGEAFAAGAAADPMSTFNIAVDTLKNAWTGLGAWAGSAASGESINEAMIRSQIATAPQAEASALMKELEAARAERMASGVNIGPISLIATGINKIVDILGRSL